MSTASEQRQALIDLTTLAKRDLFAVWQSLQGLGATETRDALAALLPDIGDTYGAAAGALAADWFDELRESAEVPGRYLAEPAPEVELARWEALAGWGVSPLFRPDPDPAAALTLIQGGLQRTVADRHRLTIVENSVRDPRAEGWRRVGDGSTCDFCRLLIGRGAVYRESTAQFKSHDHCGCSAAPTWGD